MLVENLMGKPEPCLTNNNRQLRGNDEGVWKRRKCHGMLRQQDNLNLYFMSKSYLWKMFTRQFQSNLRKVLSLRKTD